MLPLYRKKGIEALRASNEFAAILHIDGSEIESNRTPLASLFGGSWEKLIKVSKNFCAKSWYQEH